MAMAFREATQLDHEVTLLFSVVIVSHNSADLLARCVASVRHYLSGAELIVVDNASRDESLAVARAHDCDVIANETNIGYGSACNIGALRARRSLLMFLNPDVRITSLDSDGLTALAGHRPLGLVAPRKLQLEGAGHSESGLRRSWPWGYSVAREAIGPIIPREISRLGRHLPASFGRRPWLTGAALVALRSEFLDVGAFSDHLFLYYEDQELSCRYRGRGLPVTVTDAIQVSHEVGGSSSRDRVLRPVPSAASALSSVEFVGLVHGHRQAQIAWRLFRSLRWLQLTVMRRGARVFPSHRISNKLRELDDTGNAIERLLHDGQGFYPLVKHLAGVEAQRPAGARVSTVPRS